MAARARQVAGRRGMAQPGRRYQLHPRARRPATVGRHRRPRPRDHRRHPSPRSATRRSAVPGRSPHVGRRLAVAHPGTRRSRSRGGGARGPGRARGARSPRGPIPGRLLTCAACPGRRRCHRVARRARHAPVPAAARGPGRGVQPADGTRRPHRPLRHRPAGHLGARVRVPAGAGGGLRPRRRTSFPHGRPDDAARRPGNAQRVDRRGHRRGRVRPRPGCDVPRLVAAQGIPGPPRVPGLPRGGRCGLPDPPGDLRRRPRHGQGTLRRGCRSPGRGTRRRGLRHRGPPAPPGTAPDPTRSTGRCRLRHRVVRALVA